MLQALARRLRDMRTIKQLCEQAERHANAEGQQRPGAEHFLMAALELPDGTARQAFRRLQADPEAFRVAVERQYGEALRDIGVQAPVLPAAMAVPHREGLYEGQPSSQALMQTLAGIRKDSAVPQLLGAHVILAALSARHGVVPRALRSMGVEAAALADAARAELAGAKAGVPAGA